MFLSSLLVGYQGYFEDEAGDHFDYPDVWTSFAKDNLSSVFLYAAIALAVILLAVGLFVYFKRRAALKNYLTVAIALAVGFAAAVAVTMLALEFMDMQESGHVFDLVLWPTVAVGASVVLAAAAIYIDEVKREIIAVSALMAGKLVTASIDTAVQNQLIDETIKDMGEKTWIS